MEDDMLFGTAEVPRAATPRRPMIDPAPAAPAPAPAPAAAAAAPEAPAASRYPAHGDRSIWGIFLILCLVSIVELYSASSREVSSAGIYGPILRHFAMLCAGIGIVLGLEKVHYRYFYGFVFLIAIGSMLSMLYVTFFGEIVNGARRHFTIAGITLQPSEFIKLSAVFVIARLMATNQKQKGIGVKTPGIVWSAVAVLLFGLALFAQGLTNTILLMCISIAMMIIGGTEWKKLAIVLAIYGVIAGCGFAYKVLKGEERKAADTELVENETGRGGTWAKRLERFRSSVPKYEEPITATNRQEQYSFMAQANGGLFGVFPGNSRETARLPLAFSDYIFAIILEDLGFIGGLALMFLYLLLLYRAGYIARRCHRAFPVLLVVGMAVMVVFQALFHMAITTGTFPVSGQPLPLISKGGTSILVTSIAFGVMLSVSRTAVQNGTKQEVKEELSALPEGIRANNPVQI